MNLLPEREIFRWRIAKVGKHVVNFCTKYVFFSGAILGLLTSVSPIALANPSGGQVTSGSATISSIGSELQINQASQKAIIEWGSFNIDAGETTRFIQPSSSALALNRVMNSQQVSAINGNLIANGRVILINPNGVLIGSGGNIDTAGFIASSADISDDAFNQSSGIFDFDRPGFANAVIENQGHITIREEGLAALVAPTVRNNGIIEGRLAKIQLAAADTFAIDFYGDGLLNLAVDSSNTGARNLSVENSGSIIADGGSVLMTAAAASDIVKTVINNEGVIEAKGLVNRNGEIILTGAGAHVKVSGTVNASGVNGGGDIKIGGDYQGQGDLAKAATVTVSADADITADGGTEGDGGRIILWSEQATITRNRFSARGGANGGNGGLVETSSMGNLDVNGTQVDTRAPNGEMGIWLLDPQDINIQASGVAYNEPTHNNSGTGGTANIDVATINNALSTVLLAASRDITFDTNVNMTTAGAGITATAGRDLKVQNKTITTNNGALDFNAGRNLDILNSIIDTQGGNIDFFAADTLDINNSTLFSDGGNVILAAVDHVDINNSNIGTRGGDVSITGTGTGTNEGVVDVNSTNIDTTGGPTPGGIDLFEDGDPLAQADWGNSQNEFHTDANGGTITIAGQSNSNNNSNCLAAGSSANCAVADPSPSVSPSPSPTPTPTPTPTPSPSVSPSPSPTPTPSPSVSPSPSPTPTPSPSVSPSPTPTPSPSVSPSPTPTPSPSVSPSPTPTPSPSVSPSPTPTPSPTPLGATGNQFPFFEIDPLGRPIISVSNQTIVLDKPFEPIEILELNTNLDIQNFPGAGQASVLPENIAAIEPAAGDDDEEGRKKKQQQLAAKNGSAAENLAGIEPAAGGETPPGQDEGSPPPGQEDIFCANAFLENKPCSTGN